MTDATPTVRIFISSPGDVAEERDQARRVIEGLQKLYPGVTLQPVLWEDLALPATASFQESIDFILEREPIDIAVFILWSRLGTPLGAATTRPDGTPYRSGTEREFDLMLAAFERSDRQRPIVLAYKRDDDAGFERRLTASSRSELEDLITQRGLTESFIREQFFDDEGRNIRAVQSYREAVGFAQRLRVHLRHTLDDLLGVDASPRWLDEPYRGLEMFDVEHAPIFHGRDEETCDLLQRLRDQEQTGCAFTVIVGASGSGKSSLARAGVAASLVNYAGDDRTRHWCTAVVTPTARRDALFHSLVNALVTALPDIVAESIDCRQVAIALTEDPIITVERTISPAFHHFDNSATCPPSVRSGHATEDSPTLAVLLILDQFEELWINRRITPEDRERYLQAIEALACSGHVVVLATLRSDIYPVAQQMPLFIKLKGDRGQFDLLPPGPSALARLITEPARLAGVRFERDETTGRSLDQRILKDAMRDPAALPLLQYALTELYHVCVASAVPESGITDSTAESDGNRLRERCLTFAAYENVGGVEGALSRRAEAVYSNSPTDAQAALPEILPLLITVDVTGDQAVVRRRAQLTELNSTAARSTLVSRLIEARFLSTDTELQQEHLHSEDSDVAKPSQTGSSGGVASLTHEALLTHWQVVADWIVSNRDHLRMRARAEQSQRRWEQHSKAPSLLLPTGLALEEGRQLLRDAPQLLVEATAAYIRTSHDKAVQESQRRRHRRRAVVTVLSLLSLLATIGATFAWLNQVEADRQRGIAVAKAAEASRSAAEATVAAKAEGEAKQQAIEERKRAKQQLYFSRIHRAFAAIEAGRNDQAAAVLATIPFSQRKIEAYYLSRRADGTPLTLRGHRRAVNAVAFSPDGNQLVSGSSDKTLIAWDAATGSRIAIRGAHLDEITALAFSPDGTYIASGTIGTHAVIPNDALKLWSSQYGVEFPARFELLRTTLRDENRLMHVNGIAVSPSGLRIAAASQNGEIRLYQDSETLFDSWLTFSGHDDACNCVAFSPDGETLISGGDNGTVRVWDALSTDRIRRLDSHAGPVTSVAFNPNGRLFASGSFDKTVRLWDAEAASEKLTLRGHTGEISSVAFSPDGRIIASGGYDRTVRLWEVSTGSHLITLRGHTQEVTSVVFSPDGRRLASGSADGTIKVWPIDTPQSVLRGHEAAVTGIDFSPSGSRILSYGDDNTLRFWDVETGRELEQSRRTADPRIAARFGVRGTDVVLSGEDASVRVLDTETGEIENTLDGHQGVVRCLAIGREGRRIVSGSADKDVILWDADTGSHIHTLTGHSSAVSIVGVDPNSHFVVSGCNYGLEYGHSEVLARATVTQNEFAMVMGNFNRVDPTIRLWDTASGQQVQQFAGHDDELTGLAVSPNGKWMASGSFDGTVKIWSSATGDHVRTFRGHNCTVTGVLFSPDSLRVVSSGYSRTGEVAIWDVLTGTVLATLSGHTDGVQCVALSRDGRRIASGSSDSTIRLWDTQAVADTLMLRGHSSHVLCVSFSPDRRQIVTGSSDGTARVWDVDSGEVRHVLRPHESDVTHVSFTLDGRQVVTVSGNVMKTWDVTNGTELRAYAGHGEEIDAVACSPDSSRIVSVSGDKTARVWNLATGTMICEFQEHSANINCVTFAPSGKYIASGDGDGIVKVWNAETGETELSLTGDESAVMHVEYSLKGDALQSVDWDGRERKWDATSGQLLDESAQSNSVAAIGASSERRIQALPFESVVYLLRTNPSSDLWSDDAERRRAWEPFWCERDAAACEEQKNWFAARFHLRRLSELRPDDKAVEARIERAEVMLASRLP